MAGSDDAADRMAISRRDFDDVWAQKDLDAIDQIYAEDFVGHGYPLGLTVSRARYKTLVGWFHEAFPDCSIDVTEMTADEDFVYAEWTFTGTHERTLFGMPPSGTDVTFSGGGRHAHSDGRVSEVGQDVDWSDLYGQLLRGYVP